MIKWKIMLFKRFLVSGKQWAILIGSQLGTTSNIIRNICGKYHAFIRRCTVGQNFELIPGHYSKYLWKTVLKKNWSDMVCSSKENTWCIKGWHSLRLEKKLVPEISWKIAPRNVIILSPTETKNIDDAKFIQY